MLTLTFSSVAFEDERGKVELKFFLSIFFLTLRHMEIMRKIFSSHALALAGEERERNGSEKRREKGARRVPADCGRANNESKAHLNIFNEN
jgi:hypothetical protein